MSDIMDEQPITSPELLDAGEAALAGPESLKEGLRRQRQESVDTTFLDLPLPEYDNPELVGRYRMVDPKELAAMGDRLKREFKNRTELVTFGAIDSIIIACEGLFARMPGQKELIPLDAEIPMTYDTRLADYLGFEAETARDALIQCFGGNIYAIIDHNIKITRWMGNRKADLTDGLGEM
jgi:hypothetical protein